MSDITVLVTGASGFVGRHLCQMLVNQDISVIAVSRYKKDIVSTVQWCALDLKNREDVRACLETYRPTHVVHLAALKNRCTDSSGCRMLYEANFWSSLNLIEACQEFLQLKKFIFFGSCEEYGIQSLPFEEEQRERPNTAYGVSKLAITQFLQTFSRTYNFPAVILRPSLIYGPGQGTEMFLPVMIQTLIQREVFEMTRGEQVRDYIYIDDVVSAILQVLSMGEHVHGELINICSGSSIAIKNLASQVARFIGEEAEKLIRIGARSYRQGEVFNYYVCAKKAKKLLNWQSVVSLEDGLKETIRCVQPFGTHSDYAS